MTRFLFILLAVTLALASPALAMDYKPDPVYKPLNPDDPPPMSEMQDLADQGDVRAQYVLGDLYMKGRGGLAKNEKKAAYWFETSAKNGYFQGFTRLAAMAKRHKKPVEAYRWYTLAADYMSSGPWRKYAMKARDELKNEAKLDRAQLDEARKQVNLWKSDFRREKQEQREQEARQKRLEKEELKKGEIKKDEIKKDGAEQKDDKTAAPKKEQEKETDDEQDQG